jgi:hypothetical protein
MLGTVSSMRKRKQPDCCLSSVPGSLRICAEFVASIVGREVPYRLIACGAGGIHHSSMMGENIGHCT